MKKISKLLSLVAVSLLVSGCGKEEQSTSKQPSRLEAYYVIGDSTEEKSGTYTITYGQNFQNVDIKVYAVYENNDKVAVQPKTDDQSDGFTYEFTTNNESEFFALKPSAGYYSVQISYASLFTNLEFAVSQTSVAPTNCGIQIQDFEYNGSTNGVPTLYGFPEETTYVYYEAALYGENDVLGEYYSYIVESPLDPGKYNLRATITSKNYMDVKVSKDFNVRKGNFPTDKYELDFQAPLQYNFEFGKETLGAYELNVPSLRNKETGLLEFDDTATIRWVTQSMSINQFDTPFTAAVVYSCKYYKDYRTQVQVQFCKMSVIMPYNFGFTVDDVLYDSVTYDGQVHTPTYDSGYAGQELPYHVVESVSTTSATNAGEYSVTFALNDKVRTHWADLESTTNDITFNWSINKADLLPENSGEYKIKLGDLEFVKDEYNGNHLYVPYGTSVAGAAFKLLIKRTGETEFSEYPAVFENTEYTSQELNIENNVLVSHPSSYLLTSTLNVTLPSNDNYSFYAYCDVKFMPSTDKYFVMQKPGDYNLYFEDDNSYDTFYANYIYIAGMHNNDLIDSENSLFGLHDGEGFCLRYTDRENNYIMQSVSTVKLTFSVASLGLSKLIGYVIDTDVYQERYARAEAKGHTGDPEVDALKDPIDVYDEGLPYDTDFMRAEYDFVGASDFTANTEYVFDFTPFTSQMLPDKTYIVCFYFIGTENSGLEFDQQESEISKVEIECTRTSYNPELYAY